MNLRSFLGNEHGFRIIADLRGPERRHPGHIHILADKNTAERDAAFGYFPVSIGEDDGLLAVLRHHPQGGDQHGRKELIRILRPGPGRVCPAVPAVGHGDLQRVFPLQQFPDVIGLDLQALAVFRPAGRQDKVPHPLPVQHRLINAVAGDLQHCGTDGPPAGKAPAEYRHHGGRRAFHGYPGCILNQHNDPPVFLHRIFIFFCPLFYRLKQALSQGFFSARKHLTKDPEIDLS